jgi:hypothetical protein
MEPATAILMALGVLVLLGFGGFGVTSLLEREHRAAGVALELSIALAIPFFLAMLLPPALQWAMLGTILLSGAFLFLLPIGRVERDREEPGTRIDERDIMFARARLEPGTPNYDAYYALRPEKKSGDDKTRSLPGLLSAEASEANDLIFGATEATFGFIEELRDAVDGPVASERAAFEAGPGTGHIKELARYWGAREVGITELRPYHVYSHIGRGKGTYGAPITLEHRYAIAFTVEMDHQLVGAAPAAPTILESAHQYANAAAIAVQLGDLIRSMGYPALAHIDGNYRVVAPLVARDAGLGEIGRMGLLMTPHLGPRVRLGVVTTDLPMIPDPPGYSSVVLDFCRVCTKCAANCPVRAIPGGDREEIDGALRWRIDQEVCYRYWCATGTDCARCMALCPYSHPDTPMHNMVRWATRHSGAARRGVIWLDRLFYGPAPTPKPGPSWLPSGLPRSKRGLTRNTQKPFESDIGQGETDDTD